jgi:signal transduction histidine kinase
VYKNITPIASQKNIKLTLEKGEHGILRGDQVLLEQALYNLVENAIRYSSVGGKVEVRLHSDVSNVKFIVEDHGVGISPIDLPKLFLRVKPSTSRDVKTETTGLGLILVKAIVDRHHGIIRAESQLGKGSKFTMEIPRGIGDGRILK